VARDEGKDGGDGVGGERETLPKGDGETLSPLFRGMVSLFPRHDRFLVDIVIRSAQD